MQTQATEITITAVIHIRKKAKKKCSIHYIKYEDLYNAVLADIKELLCIVQKDREAFVQSVKEKLGSAEADNTDCIHREIQAIKLRIKELDAKFERLYDDRLDGLLSDKRFRELSSKCETEQEKLTERLSELNEKVKCQTEKEVNAEQFAGLISQYDTVDKLDKEILNRLIDKIVVSDKVKKENGYFQKIVVYYKFLGNMD